jgi:protein-disulfide isomerase
MILMAPYRRLSLVLLAVVAAAGLRAAAAATAPAPSPVLADEMTLGSPNAKLTLVEYASASCPHCARVNNEVFPELKKRYIDTGKVRYVFREILTPPEQFAGIAFLMARCAGPNKYFAVVDEVFHQQAAIYQSDDLAGGLIKIAAKFGLSKEQLEACTADEKAVAALNARVDKAGQDGFVSTPTFVIGDTKLETGKPIAQFVAASARLDGEKSLAELTAVIDPMLAR